jgi:hypothetical protein
MGVWAGWAVSSNIRSRELRKEQKDLLAKAAFALDPNVLDLENELTGGYDIH